MNTDVSARPNSSGSLLDGEVIRRVGEELSEFRGETGVRPPAFGVCEEGLPWDRARPRRERNELRDGAAIDGHPKTFAGLDTAKHLADVVSKFPGWHVVHGQSVATLLRSILDLQRKRTPQARHARPGDEFALVGASERAWGRRRPLRPPPRTALIVLTLDPPVAREGIPPLCERVRLVLERRAADVICDVGRHRTAGRRGGRGARPMQLTAMRLGGRMLLRDARARTSPTSSTCAGWPAVVPLEPC